MKPGAGKRKGAQFEREVCEKLSLWITNGKRKDCLWRSAMSGGRATVRNKKSIDVRQAGDVCAVAPEGHALTDLCYIETKSYRSLKFDRFLLMGTGPLMTFWRETVKQAERYNRRPMLIAKQNGLPTLVVMDVSFPITPIASAHCYVYLFNDLLRSKFKWPS